jgi:hypothetical protein
MNDSINGFFGTSNQWLNVAMLIVALLRVYLEIIDFDFAELPLTKRMFRGTDEAKRFHKHGFYLCLGYIVFSAPFTLFS